MINNEEEIFKKKKPEKKFFKKNKVAEANQFHAVDEKKSISRFFQLPKRWVDVTDPFYFKVYNFKTDGIIFLLTSLIIPFLVLVLVKIITLVNPSFDATLKSLLLSFGYFIPAIVATIFYSKRDRQLFHGTGLVYYFWPIFSNFGLGLIFSILLRTLNINENNAQLLPSLSMLFNILIDVIWIILILVYVPGIRRRIGKTFAKNWKMLFLVSILTGIIMFLVAGPLLNLILGAIGIGGKSNNQMVLESGSSILYAVLLVIFTVLVAPLYEELVYRHLYYVGVGNRTVAFFASAITFAMIHVISNGDIEHIIPYLVGGFFLSGIFSIARGNVTYSWLSHVVYNLIGVILLFVPLNF